MAYELLFDGVCQPGEVSTVATVPADPLEVMLQIDSATLNFPRRYGSIAFSYFDSSMGTEAEIIYFDAPVYFPRYYYKFAKAYPGDSLVFILSPSLSADTPLKVWWYNPST